MLRHLDRPFSVSSPLIIRSRRQLADYQGRRLRFLLSYYKIKSFDDIKPSFQIPPAIGNCKYIDLKTSGATSNRCRDYGFPVRYYDAIERHHIKRIERDRNLTGSGPVFMFFYNPHYEIRDGVLYQVPWDTRVPNQGDLSRPRRAGEAENTLYGPFALGCTGPHNNTYGFTYNRHTERITWLVNFKKMRSMNPKFIVMSPSQIQVAWAMTYGAIKLDCPVISTREVLSPQVRALGEKIFPCVIDKMRCWDGGMGFYECKHGRLHVYDELSLVEEVDGVLVSTDFYNFRHPFIRYANGDRGTLNQGLCSCGVYGNYFEDFQGRVNDALIIGGQEIIGSIILEEMNRLFLRTFFSSGIFTLSFLKKYPANIFNNIEVFWKLKQFEDASLELRYFSVPEMTPEQTSAFQSACRYIVLRDPGSFELGALDAERGKADNPLEFVLDPGLFYGIDRRTKHQCIESDIAKSQVQQIVGIKSLRS